MKRVVFCLIALMTAFSIFGAEDEEKEEDVIQSLKTEREEILKYGIDSEVTGLITTLNEEKNGSFNDEILSQIDNTSNRDIINGAFQLFISTEYRDAEDYAIKILEDNDLYNNTVLSKAMLYLGEDLSAEGADTIALLMEHEQAAVSRSAIAAIGKSGDDKYAEELLDLLEDDDFHDEVKTTILVSLGDMQAKQAVEVLTDIVLDVDEEKAWRWYACQSLGKIGKRESFDVLKSLLGDDDPNLRSFAVEAIGYYDRKETAEILISALRDSYWKVRISAAKQLGEIGETEAVGILKYKAGKDPENNVRKEAIRSLGNIGDPEGLDYLRELAGSTRTNPAIWSCAVDVLAEKDLENSMETFTGMIIDEWEKDSSYHLGYLAKVLSMKEGTFLEELSGKFLDHNSLEIKIYGLRMAEKNSFSSHRERIEILSSEDNPNSVRKNALSALEKF